MRLNFSILGSASADAIFYVPVPVACIVRKVQAAASVDPGDDETITVAKAAVAIGVLTYGASIAAGAVGAYVANASTGYTAFAKDDVIKLTISTLTAAATFCGYIEVDEFVQTVQ